MNIYPYDSVAGLWTTTKDLGLLMKALFESYKGHSSDLLKHETTIAMFDQHGINDSGYGFFSCDVRGKKVFFTQGWGEGYQSYIFSYPNEGDALIVMMNQNPNVEQLDGPIGDVVRQYINNK